MTYRPLPPWQVLERRTLLSRRWLTVHEERVRLGNGREMPDFHLVESPSWAGVLCVTRADEVVLVRQYRHGIGGESLELPAGVIEADEDPALAARRELREETGYESERWQPLVSVATEPSRQAVRAHFFCALDAVPTGARALDESEDIDVVRVPRPELFRLLDAGRIVHGIHLGAILMAVRRGLLEP